MIPAANKSKAVAKKMDPHGPGVAMLWMLMILSIATKHKRRLASDDVSRRRRVTAAWPDPADECCICLDAYTPGKYARTARCGHAFHAACFTRLVRNATLCPLCRVAL